MSIAEFSGALKNKAIKEWFNTEKMLSGSDLSYADKNQRQKDYADSNINTLINPTSDYRSAEQTATKTSFIITQPTILGLLRDLKGMDPTSPETVEAANKLFAEFRKPKNGVSVNRRKITVGNGIPAIFFNSISFDGITNLVNNILGLKPGELATQYEKGHVVGLNTQLLEVTKNRIAAIDTRGQAGKAKLLQELKNVIDYYKRLDYNSANLQPASDIKVYASVEKTIKKTGESKYIVELQTKSANQRSADEVKATIGSIRKLFTPGALSEKQMLATINRLEKVVTDQKFRSDLLTMKSSPSYIDVVSNIVLNILTDKPVGIAVKHRNVEVAKVKVPKANLSEVVKIARTELAKVKRLSSDLNKRVAKLPERSPTNLEAILRARINEQVAQNMGSGSDRRILNYRTGRLAESVDISRVSESRAGMISVFYNYMKNPYATFSDGGQQQSPKTRDPKTLISKSIREIAAPIVGNRLRSVLV